MRKNLQRMLLLVMLGAFTSMAVLAQGVKVTGKVTYQVTKETVIGAVVSVQGTTKAVLSDVDGNYEINVPNQAAVLEVSMVGYKPAVQTVGQNLVLNFELEVNSLLLENVVVVGYGSTKRSEITGSIATVKMDQLPQSTSGSVANMLQGRAAGVNIQQQSAKPGAQFDIAIRGSISGTKPLIVVDGVPQVGFTNQSTGTDYSNRNREGQLIAVNPSDIETIDILKDASSSAIYGSDAAGGVILITTKKGREGKAKINYTGGFSIQELINRPKYMGVQDFMIAQNETYEEMGRTGQKPWSAEQINNPPTGTDWYKEVTRMGMVNDHNVSLQGGTEKTHYLASLSFFDQQGVVKNNSMTRWTGRVNLDQQLAKWLKAGVNAAFTQIDYKDVPENESANELSPLMMSAMNFTPTLDIRDANGNYTLNPFRSSYPNPVSLLEIMDNTRSRALNANLYLEARFLKDFTIKATAGVDQKSEFGDQYIPRSVTIGANKGGVGSKTEGNNNLFLFNAIATYNKTFAEKHAVTAMAGYEYKMTSWDGMSMVAEKFPLDNAFNNNMGMAESRPTISSRRGSGEMASIIGRAMYSFDNRLMVTFNIRADGSSNFGPSNQWAVFPGVSAGWSIGNEKWMSSAKWIDNLKIRAGYGQTGNAGNLTGIYSYYAIMQNAYAFNGDMANGAVYAKIGNPDLKWETLTDINLGVDFSFFQGRLSGSVDLYQRTRTDIIKEKDLMSYNEIKKIDYNSPEVRRSRGVELSLNSVNIATKDFEWTTNFTISYYQNKITARDNDLTIDMYRAYDEILDNGYGYLSDGLIRNGETYAHLPNARNGSVYLKDINGYQLDENGNKMKNEHGQYIHSGKADGVLDAADMVKLYNNTPMPFSLNNSFKYKNWDLNIYFYGNLNARMYNNLYTAANGAADAIVNGLNLPEIYKDRYSEKNPNGFIPGYSNIAAGGNTGDYFLENAWYVRLDNLSLGYTFRPKKMEGIRVFAAVRNLFVITPYKGMDPETTRPSASGYTGSPYPSQRTYSIGLDIKF